MFNGANSGHVSWAKVFNPSGSNYLYSTLDRASLNATGHVLKVISIIGSPSGSHMGQKSLIIPAVRLDSSDFLAMLLQFVLALGFVLFASSMIFLKWDLKIKHPFQSVGNKGALKEYASAFRYQPVSERQFSVVRLLKSTVCLLLEEVTIWNKLLIVIIWVATIFSPAPIVQQVLLPIIVMLALPLFCSLGSRSQSSGVYGWVQTVPSGQRRQRMVEILAGVCLFWILVLPVALKNIVSLPLLLIFGLTMVILAQLLGLLSHNGRAFSVIMIVFWFAYLNGATVILPLTGSIIILAIGVYLVLMMILLGIDLLL